MATQAAEGAKLRRRTSREHPTDSDNPIDIAMASVATGKPLPDAARAVLEKHGSLIDHQITELRLRHAGERVRAALWTALAVLAFLLVVMIVSLVVRAAKSDALIVQSFRVPPTLNARGLTGEVVATQVLDKLAEMQSTSESARASSSYANNWENDLKIDIPNTGATTDQVWKLLRGWLGKETRISGEVIETGKGLALTARVGANPGQRYVSDTADLDALVAKAAELIYRHTQPYRHAIYLGQIPERSNEREALLQQLAHDPSPMEQKWAYNGLAYVHRLRGDFAGSILWARRALAIDPEMLPALGNLASAHTLLGHDQASVDLNLRERGTKVGTGYDPRIVAANRCGQLAEVGMMTRNPRQIGKGADCLESAPGSYSEYAGYTRLNANWLRHEAGPLLAFRQPVTRSVSESESAAIQARQGLRGEMLRGPSPALIRALDDDVTAAHARASTGPIATYYAAGEPTQSWPIQAEALSILSRHAEAKALIDRTPLDCYNCVRVRGVVAQHMGDRAGAQRWFLDAARQGSRLAPAFLDWGRLLADSRRYATAEPKIRRAAELAPDWADPLKSWGDLLVAQGKRGEAMAKYDAALKLAPQWAELRQARSRLQAKS